MSITTDSFIRRAERDDLDTVLSWMEDPEFQFFLYGEPAQSPRLLRERIIAMLGRSPGATMPSAVYLLIDSRSEGLLGMISLQNISWRNRSCSIDVYLGARHRRNGMTAGVAVYRAIVYAFDELNLHRIGALIYAFNRASWRIFERVGAVRELTLTRHVLRDGELHDAYGYGLLRSEFNAARVRESAAAAKISLDAMVAALAEAAEAAP